MNRRVDLTVWVRRHAPAVSPPALNLEKLETSQYVNGTGKGGMNSAVEVMQRRRDALLNPF